MSDTKLTHRDFPYDHNFDPDLMTPLEFELATLLNEMANGECEAAEYNKCEPGLLIELENDQNMSVQKTMTAAA